MQSIVDRTKIEKDPRNLAYLFPSMPLYKYSKATNEYFYWKALDAAETVARVKGALLVPANCIHWERKKKMQDQSIKVLGRSFYILHENEMTELELKKYKKHCETNRTLESENDSDKAEGKKNKSNDSRVMKGKDKPLSKVNWNHIEITNESLESTIRTHNLHEEDAFDYLVNLLEHGSDASLDSINSAGAEIYRIESDYFVIKEQRLMHYYKG